MWPNVRCITNRHTVNWAEILKQKPPKKSLLWIHRLSPKNLFIPVLRSRFRLKEPTKKGASPQR